jgi:hypothetical protein
MSILDAASNDAVCAAIDAAEEVRDPLDGLIERTTADPGAVFAPEVLERLVKLKRDDRAAFEALRAQLKKAGCRMMALDEAIAEENGDTGERGPTQADILINVAKEGAPLFHTPDGTGYADIEVNGHRETWAIRSQSFKRWLRRLFYEATGGAPNSEALQTAIGLLESMAMFDGDERAVHLRVAADRNVLYIDLTNNEWQVIELDATGWRVINRPPVRFRRAAGMLALPRPERGGSIEALRKFLNVKDNDFVLAVAWLLAALRNTGPYPVLAVSGEQGSAKSTGSKILRALVDPNTAPLRALAREDRDLFIAATNGHALAFDNISRLPTWISDTLCRLATGGGFAVRQLYTDQDEVLFDAMRPVILNGIEDVIERPDLADRAMFLTFEWINEERRRPESELWSDFERKRPCILGALLDAMVVGLARCAKVKRDVLPRMADFAIWSTACEPALWPAGTFAAAFAANRRELIEGVLDADAIASAIRALMATREEWVGTASELLVALEGVAGERAAKSRNWPTSAEALGRGLRRPSTFLRKVGIEIAFERRGRTRKILITKRPRADWVGEKPSQPSPPSQPGKINGLGVYGGGAGFDDGRREPSRSGLGGDSKGQPSPEPSPANALFSLASDSSDGSDSEIPTHSNATAINNGMQRAEDATAVSPTAESAEPPADAIEPDGCDGELVAIVGSPDCDGE